MVDHFIKLLYLKLYCVLAYSGYTHTHVSRHVLTCQLVLVHLLWFCEICWSYQSFWMTFHLYNRIFISFQDYLNIKWSIPSSENNIVPDTPVVLVQFHICLLTTTFCYFPSYSICKFCRQFNIQKEKLSDKCFNI